MPKSVIAHIIATQNLSPGDAMRTLDGDVIPSSRVLSRTMIVYADGDVHTLVSQNVLTGEETTQTLSADAMEQLRSYEG